MGSSHLWQSVRARFLIYSLRIRNYICTFSSQPTYFDQSKKQYPGAQVGSEVGPLANDVNSLYAEARSLIAANATGAALICRKLLMHIAVEKGAAKDKSFQFYVEHLAKAGYIPPDGKGWVDHIRTRGNEATHEIVIIKKTDDEELLSFLENAPSICVRVSRAYSEIACFCGRTSKTIGICFCVLPPTTSYFPSRAFWSKKRLADFVAKGNHECFYR